VSVVRVEKARVPAGTCTVVKSGRSEIAVFNVDGAYFALLNRCPHRHAPLSAGTVCGTNLPSDAVEFRYGLAGRLVRCPWHHYEFDLVTGRSLIDPDRMRVASYAVAEEPDHVVIDLERRRTA
jgi:nitrite reductase (NADH) small subunit